MESGGAPLVGVAMCANSIHLRLAESDRLMSESPGLIIE